MRKTLFFENDCILDIIAPPATPADPAIEKAVQRALKKLEPDIREIVRQYYFDGLSYAQIAKRQHILRGEARVVIINAKKQLKILLAEFVRTRWNVNVHPTCRICNHPERRIIEYYLAQKSDDESWGEVGNRLMVELGERFHPPQILIAHLEHIDGEMEDGHGIE